MKVFSSCNYWDSLRKYGINPLTGEACGYGLRILCDLTDRGADIVAGYFGMLYQTGQTFPMNWNSEVNGSPAVASVMLPREILQPLMIYIAFHVEEADVVIVTPSGELLAMHHAEDDEDFKRYMESADLLQYRILRNPVNRAASYRGRNMHAMSGRVE